jgi:hypothetical protein
MTAQPQSLHVAMMNLLWPRSGIDRQLFYDYWSGAHTQISSRLPGIHDYLQHHLDHEQGASFPFSAELPRQARTAPGFFGDAEITFATSEDLDSFAAALAPLMEDEQNVFDKTTSYLARGQHVQHHLERDLDPTPNGDLGVRQKFLLYLRKRDDVEIGDFRRSLADLGERLAESKALCRVRSRAVDIYENDKVTLLAPNVDNYEPLEQQYQAALEIVFYDALARRSFQESETWLVEALTAICAEVVPTRALRTFTVYANGSVTTAGLRTPQMAEQIARIGAINQVAAEVSTLMLSPHPQLDTPRLSPDSRSES